jgi:HSP20 family protein
VQAFDLDLSVQQNLLTLKARRQWEAPARAQVLWQGFGAGQWQQTFTLPGEDDAERVDARLADGVLRLRLPKAQHLRPRQITVQAGRGGGASGAGETKTINAPTNGAEAGTAS